MCLQCDCQCHNEIFQSLNNKEHTLESLILVAVGTIVLVGIFVKINKRTGIDVLVESIINQSILIQETFFASIIIINFNQNVR